VTKGSCPVAGLIDNKRRFLQATNSSNEGLRPCLFGGGRELGEVIEDVARLGALLIIQIAPDAEVDAFLDRARYQRSAAVGDPGRGCATDTARRRSRPRPGR
jgi:hypothetical protein